MKSILKFWREGDGDSFWRSRVVIGSLLLAFMIFQIISGVVRAQVPACWPDVQLKAQKVAVVDLPKGFRDKRVAFWTCATPTGYQNTWMVYNDADLAPWVPKLVANKFVPDDATTNCKAQCATIYEDNLVAAVRKLQAPYKATATVSASGDLISRPVYLVVNGVRQTTAVPLVRVGVGAPCWLNGKLPGAGNWFRVDGLPNVFTAFPDDKLGSHLVAQCSVTLPLGANGG